MQNRFNNRVFLGLPALNPPRNDAKVNDFGSDPNNEVGYDVLLGCSVFKTKEAIFASRIANYVHNKHSNLNLLDN